MRQISHSECDFFRKYMGKANDKMSYGEEKKCTLMSNITHKSRGKKYYIVESLENLIELFAYRYSTGVMDQLLFSEIKKKSIKEIKEWKKKNKAKSLFVNDGDVYRYYKIHEMVTQIRSEYLVLSVNKRAYK